MTLLINITNTWAFVQKIFCDSSSCLSICNLILNFIVCRFTVKPSKVVYLQWVFSLVFWNAYVFSLCLHFKLILFTSTKFCTILTQFDVIQGELKLILRLHGKNESAKLRAYAPYPSLIHTLRACTPLLTNKRLTRLFFVLCFCFNCKIRLKT